MRFVARAARRAGPVRSSSTSPGVHNVQQRARRDRRSVARPASPTRAIAKALAEFRGVGRRFQRYGDVALRTAAALHADRRLRPSPGRDGGDDRRGARQLSRPAARARVPAASLHAHARPVRGLRRACCRPSTRWCWPTSIRPASRRSSRPTAARSRARCASPARSSRCSSRRSRDVAGARFARSRATATSCVTMGAGSIGQVAAAQLASRMMMTRAAASSRRCAARSTRDAPLARYTSWRCGGPPTGSMLPRGSRRPRRVRAPAVAATSRSIALGLGSNTLVRDGGVRGTVVDAARPGAPRSRWRDGLIYARGGRREPESRALRGDARLRRTPSSWRAFPARSAARWR